MDQHMKTHLLDLSDQLNISLQNRPIEQNLHPIMSEKEVEIRGELEMDIERDLEQEIKDGIYHLALRLHRLHHHQEKRNKIVSEVNISIKMEGGTKIEIKETKKELNPHDHQEKAKAGRPRTAKSDKFDWEKSLRKSKVMNKTNVHMDMKLENARRNGGDKVLKLGWKCEN
ncbi:uncharacterized protein LOC126656478 [Mercurialis annua]|uniref:uncharacterized protein LOC126656478 n=1 Tax=Mercurialis annua TaxID=3986 RepID=UPI00215F7ADF|nr:uncharacterized protein LOC126656478 [Mercurialis annua]